MKASETLKTTTMKDNQANKSQELYLILQKEVKLHKSESALQKLLFLPVSTLMFFSATASYGIYFVITYWETWYFAFSGSVVTLFSVLYTILAIWQLKQISFTDYDAPVANIKRSIISIKSLTLQYLRLATWLFPFAPFIGVFTGKAIFGFNLTTIVSVDFIAAFSLITIIIEIVSLVILNALSKKNLDKNWVRWLLAGSGSRLDEALYNLEQMNEDDTEKID
jgi:hypothetical protein